MPEKSSANFKTAPLFVLTKKTPNFLFLPLMLIPHKHNQAFQDTKARNLTRYLRKSTWNSLLWKINCNPGFQFSVICLYWISLLPNITQSQRDTLVLMTTGWSFGQYIIQIHIKQKVITISEWWQCICLICWGQGII